MKQSLWDLKLQMILSLLVTLNFEAVPMGFETQPQEQKKELQHILKQSLWDLKLPSIPKSSRVALILKQSLWDLKQLFSTCFVLYLHNFEAVPMGFETNM